jgi:hypothetical protein
MEAGCRHARRVADVVKHRGRNKPLGGIVSDRLDPLCFVAELASLVIKADEPPHPRGSTAVA